MKIDEFIKRFKSYEELEDWLKRQRKDYLYSIYMADLDYDGMSYRKITKKHLKNIFLVKYTAKELEKEKYI